MSHLTASLRRHLPCILSVAWIAFASFASLSAQSVSSFETLENEFKNQHHAFLKQYCLECHSTSERQGELDLEQFLSVKDIRKQIVPWQRVVEMMSSGEMPPKDFTSQPTAESHQQFVQWVQSVLDADAHANAGDPGPVVLRRLNNAEYDYTLSDLTGLSIKWTQEFPEDSAAGEGFTNVGNALAMSPAMLQKYMDAANEISRHAVLVPSGIQFSSSTTSRDWTNEKLDEIRAFYAKYTEMVGGTAVNLQGVQFETNGGGRLPIENYLRITLLERDALQKGATTIKAVAAKHQVQAKYLQVLWDSLHDSQPSIVMDSIRDQWNSAQPDDAPKLAASIQEWQKVLWRFATIGHIGKRDGPKAWQLPTQPIASRQEVRSSVPPADAQGLVRWYLVTSDAGDGTDKDVAIWENPRLASPGRPDLLLRDVRAAANQLARYRSRVTESASECLDAISQAIASGPIESVAALAQAHHLDPMILSAWLHFLGIESGEVFIDSYVTSPMKRIDNFDFVQGWAGAGVDALSIIANSSDEFVRVPGDMKPHSVAAHPAPRQRIAVGWKCPTDGLYRVAGTVQRAHIGCGNGVRWHLEVRRGSARQRLAEGLAGGAELHQVSPASDLLLKKGEMLSLVIDPRDAEHSCDLTAIDLSIQEIAANGKLDRSWELAKDLSSDILAGNPHADRHGNAAVWHFYSEPIDLAAQSKLPAGSALALWQSESDSSKRHLLAQQIEQLLRNGPPNQPADSPDHQLHRQLISLSGPLFSFLRAELLQGKDQDRSAAENGESTQADAYGLPLEIFGVAPDGSKLEPSHLCVSSPSVYELVIPAELVEGYELVATGTLHPVLGREGSVQMHISHTKPSGTSTGVAMKLVPDGGKATWSDGDKPVKADSPILLAETSAARKRIEANFDTFRRIFPAALCYTKIVPVDEVVTLTLFYREDDYLKQLMLGEEESAELDRLWGELLFISQEPLAMVDAYEQLWQFATQDADPSAFTPMKDGIMQRAEAFRKLQKEVEAVHVEAVLDFAERAWRRPLTALEQRDLRELMRKFRFDELPHDAAMRRAIARILVAPAFLYRMEHAPEGEQSLPVASIELANRLSYTLWSSKPDEELLEAAAKNRLASDEEMRRQLRRMLSDDKMRRFAIEFGCQWLHIRNFDQHDEKSEQHFPEFAELRQDMYEESIRVLEDLFRNDGSLLELLEPNHTFVNHRLASFYGLTVPNDGGWHRVESGTTHRGGVLTLGATLAKQSGASRTSPILRGNWVSEFLLGERLPRPPKDVPVLPEEKPVGLTERQLIERHSSDAACAKCHLRIDGFGFAMEQFDAIGRWRTQDASGLAIDAKSELPDGSNVEGIEGLRSYLANERRDDFLRTFCKRLLGYSLGRSVQLSDEPLLQEMLLKLKENDYRFSVAMECIVLSPQFRRIRPRDFFCQ